MADEPQEGRMILCQEDGRNVPAEATYRRETFRLTQRKMAELFNVTVPTINEHLKTSSHPANRQRRQPFGNPE
jgi:hypothetical protein